MYIFSRLIRLMNQTPDDAPDHILADYFLCHAEQADTLNTETIQNSTGVSKPTISRFIQNGGYAGFHAFIHDLKREYREQSQRDHDLPAASDSRYARILAEKFLSAGHIRFYGNDEEYALALPITDMLIRSGRPVTCLSLWDM